MEDSSIDSSDIIYVLELQEVLLQFYQLVVLGPRERSNRNSVIDIEPVRIERVVDDDYLTEIAVEYSEVFDVGATVVVEVAISSI
jgi:hypothetical protein